LETRHVSEDILVVDDQSANLIAIQAALQGVAGEVVLAQSGEEALRILLNRDFAVVLLDVRMPGIGGLEAARLIRERKRSHHTPIIFVTAHGYDDGEVRDAYALGAVDFLAKPLVLEILRAKVSVFVELQRRADELERQGVQLLQMEQAQRAAAAMAEADRHKDEFLALLGHELRNPLVPLTAGLEVLRRRLGALPNQDEVVTRTRQAMERQVKHLTRLVDDLLDVSRINAGKIELRRTEVDLRDVLEQALSIIRPPLAERGHKLEIDVPAEPLPAFADSVRLVQIFVNLLRNAIQYTGEGGQIRLQCGRAGDQVEVSVGDSGRGIAPEFLPFIFEKFVQERAGGGGLGLGLMLVKRLTEMHGGTVAAKSDGVGQGSQFVVRLPLLTRARPSAPAAPRRAGADDSGMARRLRLALVDDNPDIRETMSELLMICGHDVEQAADGAAGLALILKMQPDVALVDIGLPKLDGYQVAEKVRASDGLGKVRLVAMTGFGQEDDRRRALQAGFDAHIVKPADLDVLLRVLSPDGA
jgi:signal transduction histidine kinase